MKPIIGAESSLPEQDNSALNAVSDKKIAAEREYIRSARLQLDIRPSADTKIRRLAFDAADQALSISSKALTSNNSEKAQFAYETARTLIDFGMGFFPPTSLGKSIVELSTGYNYITRKELETLDYVAAWVDVLSLGIGGKVVTTAETLAEILLKLDVIQTATKGLAHASIVATTGAKAEKLINSTIGM